MPVPEENLFYCGPGMGHHSVVIIDCRLCSRKGRRRARPFTVWTYTIFVVQSSTFQMCVTQS